ncbi:45 kDa calcium-binding protein [Scaptodrosophila lebanonensis]|uniref:45 kDa calcium-binding protein n=1 Tax=Drosophila lebanonensis TaxID=7225 RepID=A0A6J2THI5_DROLE|nr:45 kDa calcium-binding protein [Scaptodrosophila lebanonensis]
MTFVNKLSKSFRWLRWSTLCAILFYMFFIGLILHSTSYKLQHTQQLQLKSQGHNSRAQQHSPEELEQQHQQQQHQQTNSAALLLTTHNLGNGNAPAAALIANTNANTNANVNANVKVNAALQESWRAKVQAKKSGTAAAEAAGGGKSPEPETVILAASNVNEKQILGKAFKRADRNHDGRLSIQELGQYINRRIVEHIDDAIMNNAREFRRVDIAPADGLITWDEYHRFFLREHGMTEADIDEHDEIRHTALNRKAREDMMRDKARWSEAARTDLFTLTIDEYLSFRHPESSVSNLLELVDDLLRQFDQDGDDQLTLEEFSDLNVDDDDDLMRKSLISKTLVERREEFKRIIDSNHDGKADRGELLNYVNPKTPRYALQEAATLFSLCDENKDELLTLKEMTDNAEIFLQSKMIDTANSFHTEF